MITRPDQVARHRAYIKLAHLFPEAFKTLLNRERAELDLAPLAEIKRGRPPKVNKG